MKFLLLVVVLLFAHLVASAPLRVLKIRNLTFLIVESPDGDRVDVLYAPSGKTVASLPIGSVAETTSTTEVTPEPAPEVTPEPDDEFDPELDEPRVEPSVIQAPRTGSGCGFGRRKDRNGRCRLIW